MIVPCGVFSRLYEDMKIRCSLDKLSILILVGPGVDAICSTFILTTILDADHVTYSIERVFSEEELKRSYDNHSSTSIRNIFLINCGISTHLRSLLRPPPHIKLIVLDSKRPVSLLNAHDPRQIILIDDVVDSLEQSVDSIRRDHRSDDLIEESSDDDSYVVDLNSPFDPRFDDWEAAYVPGHEPPFKKVRNDDDYQLSMKLWCHKRAGFSNNAVDFYYNSPTVYGFPTSLTLYETLVKGANRTSNLAWAVCVGSTEYNVFDKIPVDQWGAICLLLKGIIQEITVNDEADENSEPLIKISVYEDFIFSLYRYTSLQNSMEMTPSISAAFKLHKDVGRSLFYKVMARIGVVKRDLTINYDLMTSLGRENLDKYSEETCQLFNLPSFKSTTFFLKRYCRSPVSARDVVHVLSLISVIDHNSEFFTNFSNYLSLPRVTSPFISCVGNLLAQDEFQFNNLIKACIELLTLVGNTCRTILLEKLVKPNNQFYDVRLANSPNLLHSHYSLSLLIHFIQVAVSALSKTSQVHSDSLPVVLSCFAKQEGQFYYYIVGKVNLSRRKDYLTRCFVTLVTEESHKFPVKSLAFDSAMVKMSAEPRENLDLVLGYLQEAFAAISQYEDDLDDLDDLEELSDDENSQESSQLSRMDKIQSESGEEEGPEVSETEGEEGQDGQDSEVLIESD
ncbi:hypothetical protein RCL1_004647 [Eukaryota sp. TZLM3-RCL]